MRLETGVLQTEALGLYRRLGYQERGPYGDYETDPLSVFMEKRLS
jgi:putative acetyltransferase